MRTRGIEDLGNEWLDRPCDAVRTSQENRGRQQYSAPLSGPLHSRTSSGLQRVDVRWLCYLRALTSSPCSPQADSSARYPAQGALHAGQGHRAHRLLLRLVVLAVTVAEGTLLTDLEHWVTRFEDDLRQQSGFLQRPGQTAEFAGIC